jgi:nucleoside 2-deoxyribosyltransferase
MKIYLAAPIFSRAEREFNSLLATEIRQQASSVDLLLPQEFVASLDRDERFFRRAFDKCVDAINGCDVVVAIVDGADADSGTCFEIGYAHAKNIPVVAIRTDFRALEDQGVNLMISQSAKHFLNDSEMNIGQLAAQIVKHAEALVRGGPRE